MGVGRGVLVAHLFTTLFQQPATQAVHWAPPAPCDGDSMETHAYRGNPIAAQPSGGSAAPRGSVDTLIVGTTPSIAAVPPSQSSQGQFPRLQSSPRAANSVVSTHEPSPPAPAEVDEPMDWSWLWKSAVVIGVLLGVAAAVRRVKDKRLLAGLRVTPHQHSGHSRVVNAKRRD